MHYFYHYLLILICFLIYLPVTQCVSRNGFDISIFKSFRRSVVAFLQQYQDLNYRKQYGKFQPTVPESTPFFCDIQNGIGKRSLTRPTSINRVRPADIDIIASMGDSLTSGNALASVNVLDTAVENRGMSWSGGGQETWRTLMTLPNILKVFNPKLYGYASENSLTFERASRFNVAEGAAESHDMLYQAKVLKLRLENDRNVNMTHDWKMVTLYFGALDACFYFCSDPMPVSDHEKDLEKAFRYLRDNVPRLFVNLIASGNPRLITAIKKATLCEFTFTMACSCFSNWQSKERSNFSDQIMIKYHQKEEEVVNRAEYHTEEFTVNYIPFTRNITFPTLANGFLDTQYFAADCFHFSQRFHAILTTNLWNSLLQPNQKKIKALSYTTAPQCPTPEHPYIATRQNSATTNHD